MDTRLDVVAKQLGAPASRRRVVRGLGALGLGALGLVGLSRTTAANGARTQQSTSLPATVQGPLQRK